MSELQLSDFKVGDRVRYVPLHAHRNQYHADCESGTVTFVGGAYVFVLFAQRTNAQSCKPDQLVKL